MRAVITLAASDRHVGAIYQVCNFKYYGLTDKKCDFWCFDTQRKQRGKPTEMQGAWVARTQKHRYAFILDNRLKCLYEEQQKPRKEEIVPFSCCGGTKVVKDNKRGVEYTCPICTGHLFKIISGKETPPDAVLREQAQTRIEGW